MGRTSTDRIRESLVSLAHRDQDPRTLAIGAARILRRAVPFDGVCLVTLDPATLLPTSEVLVENGLPPSATPRMAEIEVGEEDVNKFPALARAPRRAASLSEATDGDLDRSLRHRELRRPHGFGDELRAALVSDGATWGGMTLLREARTADFTHAHSQLVDQMAGPLAEGLRRAIVRTAIRSAEPGEEPAAGVIVLEPDNSIAQTNHIADAWLAELLEQAAPDKDLPNVVTAVASRARGAAAGRASADARARVRTPSGTWLLVHGSTLGDGPEARSVVILEPARTPELAPLVAEAYGLSERERAVIQLVAQGLATNAIADRLHLSPWTVQDHLKAIFEKTGTGTRGELVAHLFFEHYAPQLTTASEQ